MIKAIVMGCACLVVSSMTPEEIERFELFNPTAIILEKENGKSFSIQLDEGPGSLTNDCASFSRTTTADGKATITILLDPDADDKLALVQKQIGPSLLKLNELEEQMMVQKEKLQEMEDSAYALITQM